MSPIPERTLIDHGRLDPAKVKARRLAAGYKNIHAAEPALKGVINHVTLRKWENVRNPPKRVFLDTLQAFAAAYGCTVEDFLTDPQEENG